MCIRDRNVTAKDWETYCKLVGEIEGRHWENNDIESDVTDNIIINLGLESDDSDSEIEK